MAEYKENRDDAGVLIGVVRTRSNGATECFNIDIGNREYRKYLAWVAAGGVIDTDDTLLDRVKGLKIKEYQKEGINRIKGHVVEWEDESIIKAVASTWRQMSNHTAAQISAKDVYVYVKNTAIPNVNAQTTVEAVQIIDVTNDTNFPL
tara:strand:+ start:1094 stop:1537 length:444 start_codon:yes stop_codon:yes gene_type:complete